MKNTKIIIIAIACICLICAGFYFFLDGKNTDNEKELTEVEKVIVKDLEKDYPKTPREVVKFYNRILKCYYGGEATAEQLNKLVDQMICIFDDELLLVNPRDEYYNSVLADIQSYKDQKKSILETDVCDSNDVMYITDTKEGTDNADELAYVSASYFIKIDGQFSKTHQEFVLRQDADGHWKLLTFYVVEGESSEDDE